MGFFLDFFTDLNQLLADILLFINRVLLEIPLIVIAFLISIPFSFLIQKSAKRSIRERDHRILFVAILTLLIYAIVRVIVFNYIL